jgi:hypothetical protein
MDSQITTTVQYDNTKKDIKVTKTIVGQSYSDITLYKLTSNTFIESSKTFLTFNEALENAEIFKNPRPEEELGHVKKINIRDVQYYYYDNQVFQKDCILVTKDLIGITYTDKNDSTRPSTIKYIDLITNTFDSKEDNLNNMDVYIFAGHLKQLTPTVGLMNALRDNVFYGKVFLPTFLTAVGETGADGFTNSLYSISGLFLNFQFIDAELNRKPQFKSQINDAYNKHNFAAFRLIRQFARGILTIPTLPLLPIWIPYSLWAGTLPYDKRKLHRRKLR